MAVLRVENLKKSYGERTLFSDVSFEIAPGEHVGMIGTNGTGKTTLLRILQKEEEPDSGRVAVAVDAKVSNMEQNPQLDAAVNLYDFALSAFSDLISLEGRLADVAEKIEQHPSDIDRLISLQDSLLEQYDRRGGSTFRARTRSSLIGLGFTEQELERSVLEFSGGQIAKAMLAKTILADADILYLDEPTNNLDVVAVRWLEEYLRSFKGAVLLISHDRAFLDGTVTRILEMTNSSVISGKGNYTTYLEKKMTARELAAKQYQRQQKEISRIEGIIAQQKRWNQAHNYVTIASKQKQIERIRAEMVPLDKDEKHIVFRFPEPAPTGNEVIVLKDLGKTYGRQTVFEHLDLLIEKGQCVCLIGENGCGKSTLLKILTGQELPTSGSFRIGAGVRIGYYAQHTRDLHEEKTILEELYDSFPKMLPDQLRGYLGMFLFRGDDIHKVIGSLSGGERARIQLLKLVLSGANVLLLDEPTNHLDIASMEVLERAIEQFEGTSVIVSHDRYLVGRLADRVIVLTPDGLIEQQDEDEDMFEHIKRTQRNVPAQAKDTACNTYLKRKEIKAAQNQARQTVRRIEAEIRDLDREVKTLQIKMQDATSANDFKTMDEVYKRMAELQTEETELYERLDAAEKQLESQEMEEEL